MPHIETWSYVHHFGGSLLDLFSSSIGCLFLLAGDFYRLHATQDGTLVEKRISREGIIVPKS